LFHLVRESLHPHMNTLDALSNLLKRKKENLPKERQLSYLHKTIKLKKGEDVHILHRNNAV